MTVTAAGFLIFRRVKNSVQYLLLQASNGEHHWSPPKGRTEKGESELETAYRETEEEAGLSRDNLIFIEKYKKVLEYEAFGKAKRAVYWLAELKNPETPIIISHEHQDFEWLDFTNALTYAKFPNLQEMIQEANQFLIDQWTK